MKNLSLKLRDDVFSEVEQVVHSLQTTRNAYINQALEFYSRLLRRKQLRARLQKESHLVRKDSLQALELFEQLEDELPG